MSAVSVNPEIDARVQAIKHRATDKFHNDHADGDLAIYDVIEEMSVIIKEQYENAESIQAELDDVYYQQSMNLGEQ